MNTFGGDESSTTAVKYLMEPSTAGTSIHIVEKEPKEVEVIKKSISVVDSSTKANGYTVRKLDIWLLGLMIASGSSFHDWEEALAPGIHSFVKGALLMGIAYICLFFCISEVSSAVPFSGGVYGISRCTIGFFIGFLVGCFEVIEHLLCTSLLLEFLGRMICEAIPSLCDYYPLVAFGFCMVFFLIHFNGIKSFWTCNFIASSTAVLILLIYCLGSLKWMNYQTNAPGFDEPLRPGSNLLDFFKTFPFYSCFFIGMENMNRAATSLESPHKKLPMLQVTCVIVLLVKMFFFFFISISLPGGTENLTSYLSWYTPVFQLLFQTSKQMATITAIPITFASANGFLWGSLHLITSMSKSRLLPIFLSRKSKYTMILTIGSSYLLSLGIHGSNEMKEIIYFMALMAAALTYVAYCAAFLKMKWYFPNLQRSFHSPFGVIGAIYAILIWLINFIVMAIFEHTMLAPFFGSMTFICTCFYYGYVRRRQQFSEEEARVLLVIHVSNYNKSKESNRSSHHASKGRKVVPILVRSSLPRHSEGGRYSRGSCTRQSDMSTIVQHPPLPQQQQQHHQPMQIPEEPIQKTT